MVAAELVAAHNTELLHAKLAGEVVTISRLLNKTVAEWTELHLLPSHALAVTFLHVLFARLVVVPANTRVRAKLETAVRALSLNVSSRLYRYRAPRIRAVYPGGVHHTSDVFLEALVLRKRVERYDSRYHRCVYL